MKALPSSMPLLLLQQQQPSSSLDDDDFHPIPTKQAMMARYPIGCTVTLVRSNTRRRGRMLPEDDDRNNDDDNDNNLSRLMTMMGRVLQVGIDFSSSDRSNCYEVEFFSNNNSSSSSSNNNSNNKHPKIQILREEELQFAPQTPVWLFMTPSSSSSSYKKGIIVDSSSSSSSLTDQLLYTVQAIVDDDDDDDGDGDSDSDGDDNNKTRQEEEKEKAIVYSHVAPANVYFRHSDENKDGNANANGSSGDDGGGVRRDGDSDGNCSSTMTTKATNNQQPPRRQPPTPSLAVAAATVAEAPTKLPPVTTLAIPKKTNHHQQQQQQQQSLISRMGGHPSSLVLQVSHSNSTGAHSPTAAAAATTNNNNDNDDNLSEITELYPSSILTMRQQRSVEDDGVGYYGPRSSTATATAAAAAAATRTNESKAPVYNPNPNPFQYIARRKGHSFHRAMDILQPILSSSLSSSSSSSSLRRQHHHGNNNDTTATTENFMSDKEFLKRMCLYYHCDGVCKLGSTCRRSSSHCKLTLYEAQRIETILEPATGIRGPIYIKKIRQVPLQRENDDDHDDRSQPSTGRVDPGGRVRPVGKRGNGGADGGNGGGSGGGGTSDEVVAINHENNNPFQYIQICREHNFREAFKKLHRRRDNNNKNGKNDNNEKNNNNRSILDNVCLPFHLKGKCNLGKACRRYHTHTKLTMDQIRRIEMALHSVMGPNGPIVSSSSSTTTTTTPRAARDIPMDTAATYTTGTGTTSATTADTTNHEGHVDVDDAVNKTIPIIPVMNYQRNPFQYILRTSNHNIPHAIEILDCNGTREFGPAMNTFCLWYHLEGYCELGTTCHWATSHHDLTMEEAKELENELMTVVTNPITHKKQTAVTPHGPILCNNNNSSTTSHENLDDQRRHCNGKRTFSDENEGILHKENEHNRKRQRL